MSRFEALRRGDLVWASPDPAVGSEQRGRRPALVVASTEYLLHLGRLAVVLPVTSRARGWPTHVPLRGSEVGLGVPSFAMTEQVRTIDRLRIEGLFGRVDAATLRDIDFWLRNHLSLN